MKKILFFGFVLLFVPISFAMQKESPVNSFDVRMQRLQEKFPETYQKFIELKENKKNSKEIAVDENHPYYGPKIFDSISTSIYVNNFKNIAIADMDASVIDIYPADKPFVNVTTLKSPGMIYGLRTLATNGPQLASVSGFDILLWNLETGQLLATLQGHENYVQSLSLVSDTYLCSGSDDMTIKVWDMRSHQNIKTFKDEAMVTSVDGPCGPGNPLNLGQIASTNTNSSNNFTIWDYGTGKKLLRGEGRCCVKYNLACNEIFVGAPGEALLYDAVNLKLMKALQLPENWKKVGACPLSINTTNLDSLAVIGGELSDVFVCNRELGKIITSFDSGLNNVDVHFNATESPATTLLTSTRICSNDGGSYLRLWPFDDINKIAAAATVIQSRCKFQ
jgi:WD40 repeat protein